MVDWADVVCGLLHTSVLVSSEQSVDEVDPFRVGGLFVEGGGHPVDVEGWSGVHVAVSAHLDSIVRQVEDRIASHLGVES